MLRSLKMLLPGCVLSLLIGAPPARAITQESLTLVADFADRICDQIETSGQSSNLILEGSADAEISALLKSLVNVGVSGAAKYESSEYVGVLREDLADALKDSRNCKLEVVTLLQDDLSKSDPPIAQDDDIATQEDIAITFNVTDNDKNIASPDSVIVNRLTDPRHGELVYEGAGVFRYIPEPDFHGQDQFSYSLTSDAGESFSAVVRITVDAKNDPPKLSLKKVQIIYPFDSAYLLDVAGLATDTDGDTVRLKTFSSPSSMTPPSRATDAVADMESVFGSLSEEQRHIADGMLVLPIEKWVNEVGQHAPSNSFNNKIEYVISDSRGGSSSGSIDINVKVARLAGLRFRCSETAGPLPRRISFDLKIGNQLVSERTVNSSRAEDWIIGLGHMEVVYTEFEDVILTAQWPRSDNRFELSCKPAIVAEGKEMLLSEVNVRGTPNRTGSDYHLFVDGETLFASTEVMLQSIFGRPLY